MVGGGLEEGEGWKGEIEQGTLTEGEGSVQLSSLLR